MYQGDGNTPWASGTYLSKDLLEPINIEMSQAMYGSPSVQPAITGEVGYNLCVYIPGGAIGCAVAMVVAAVLVELSKGDEAFGPGNEIRVVGGQISAAAKEVGGQVAKDVKKAGGQISDWWKQDIPWFRAV